MDYIGIDISKASFDVAFPAGKAYKLKKYANNAAGFAQLLAHLGDGCCCVMEATGPYYMRLATFLHEQQIAVAVINPLVIKRFSQMRLLRAKTDQADAKLIAAYGQCEQPGLWTPPLQFISELQQESTVLEGLIKQRTALKNQKEAFDALPHVSQQALDSLDQLLQTLNEQISLLEKSMARKAKEHGDEQLECLRSIPGIGQKTAIQLFIVTQGFSRFETSKQLSAYIGISPRIYQSGTSVKGRPKISKLGMSRLRATLYMCTWSAVKCNKACREFYERLLAKGKAKNLALIAVANKLVKQAFAIATKKQIYKELIPALA
jgi:transposase